MTEQYEEQVITATVVRERPENGYWFASSPSVKDDIFIYYKDIKDYEQTGYLARGDIVSLLLVSNPKHSGGWCGKRVTRIGKDVSI